MDNTKINLNEVSEKNLSEASNDPTKLSRSEICLYVSDYLYRKYKITDTHLQHLIAIFANEIETYRICQKRINEDGILILQNNRKTQGPNPHIAIMHKSIKNIMRIMRELKMELITTIATRK